MHRTAILPIHIVVILVAAIAAASAAPGQTPAIAAKRPANDAQIRAAGIRQLTSRHLTLYTDLPADPEVDRLPALFDQAVPQWADYFGVDKTGAARSEITEMKLPDWHVWASLIKDRKRFDDLGLMPPPGPDRFANGISMGSKIWLYEQPTVYYRRHLLLHEGTHAFMVTFLGGCGPGWYMEGMAERMATHRLDPATGQLTLRIMPADRDEVAMLGRIKLIRDAVAADRPLDLAAVMQIDNRRVLETEAYAWGWAATAFLDSNPRYRDRFRTLWRHVLDPGFNDIVRREYNADWSDLTAEWAAYVAALDHGYDFERMAIDFRRGQPLTNGQKKSAVVRTDRGWKSSGVWLEAGRAYRVTASGRYQIAEEAAADGKLRPWPCEPGGVTIDYYAGRPLGMLLGAVDARDAKTADANFAHPISIGLDATIRPTASGTLYLRVNDSAGRLNDNRGTLTAVVENAETTQ
jgi:hypothetical protein